MVLPLADGDPSTATCSWVRSHFYEVVCGGATDLVLAKWNRDGKLVSFAVGDGFGDLERALGARTFLCEQSPVRDAMRVVWAGSNLIDNYHFYHRSQRYAVDLAPLSEEPVEVYAPVDGTVIEVTDGEHDNDVGRPPQFTTAGGNTVSIRAGDATVHLCHLRRGTVRVNRGDDVKAGAVLGVVGNSGNSSFPHLHIHAQQAAAPYHGIRLLWPVPEDCAVVPGAILRTHDHAGTSSGSGIAS